MYILVCLCAIYWTWLGTCVILQLGHKLRAIAILQRLFKFYIRFVVIVQDDDQNMPLTLFPWQREWTFDKSQLEVYIRLCTFCKLVYIESGHSNCISHVCECIALHSKPCVQ